jgi:site-specific DNA-methyltransferase (adenine-specific)
MKTKPLKCYNGGKNLLVVPPTVPEVIANTSQGVKSSATILKGDCLAHMKSLPDKSVDLIICDLPYGCLEVKRKARTETYATKLTGSNGGCPWDIKIDLEVFWREVKRIRKSDHTPCIHFCTTKFGYELIRSNEKEFRHDLVWDKQRGVSFLSANKMPMRSHEMVYVFSKAGANYNRIDYKGEFKKVGGGRNNKDTASLSQQYGSIPQTAIPENEGKRCVLSVIQHSTSHTRGGHPTEKPIDLYKWLIERYSKEGETVLDPTAGSFNSGVASVELNRKYIGIEKDTAFFNKAISKFV